MAKLWCAIERIFPSTCESSAILQPSAGNMCWAFWASTSTAQNRSPKHGPARNNMGRASMARSRA
jgi:hypothetical protein